MNDDDISIQCNNITKIFETEAEDLHILENINLSLKSGSCVSISGPSGCGKSTFLSIIGGLDRPSSGSITVSGIDLTTVDDVRLSRFRAENVGFVFQFHYLLKDLTAIENVMLPAYMLHGNKALALESAEALLAATDLSHRLHHIPSKLSGGERQRVAIARALINNPSIILADEPTGNLDRSSAKLVEDLLFDLSAKRNITLLIVTHDTRLAERADIRLTIRDGQVIIL